MVRMVPLIISTFTITSAIFAPTLSLIVRVGCLLERRMKSDVRSALAFNISQTYEILRRTQYEDQLLRQGSKVTHFINLTSAEWIGCYLLYLMA
jgi:hypothetical protein